MGVSFCVCFFFCLDKHVYEVIVDVYNSAVRLNTHFCMTHIYLTVCCPSLALSFHQAKLDVGIVLLSTHQLIWRDLKNHVK